MKRIKTTDPNRIYLYDTHCEMELRDIHGKPKGVCKFDYDFLETAKIYKWNNHEGYARAGGINKEQLRMHRMILNCPKEKVVHHINGNPLDNRKMNLTILTKAEHNLMKKGRHNKNYEIQTDIIDMRTNKIEDEK